MQPLAKWIHFAFSYIARIVKSITAQSDVGCLLFQNVGEERVHQRAYVDRALSALGYRHLTVGGVTVFVTSDKFPTSSISKLANRYNGELGHPWWRRQRTSFRSIGISFWRAIVSSISSISGDNLPRRLRYLHDPSELVRRHSALREQTPKFGQLLQPREQLRCIFASADAVEMPAAVTRGELCGRRRECAHIQGRRNLMDTLSAGKRARHLDENSAPAEGR
jgi:hypothetical protein